jgi:4-carboxymuconolactone decarboxylase
LPQDLSFGRGAHRTNRNGVRMSRVTRLSDDEMSAEQKAIAASIAGTRSGVLGGPFAIWIRVPEIAKRIEHLSDRLRKNSGFEKRLVELMVLLIVRPWRAEYAWTAHARQALEAGISADAIEAIRTNRVPAFTRADEQLIYDIFTDLNQTRALGDANYARGLDAFGLDLMIEMVTTAGLYTMIGMMLAVFDVPPSTGTSTLS